jgi:hypothetical protein
MPGSSESRRAGAGRTYNVALTDENLIYVRRK